MNWARQIAVIMADGEWKIGRRGCGLDGDLSSRQYHRYMSDRHHVRQFRGIQPRERRSTVRSRPMMLSWGKQQSENMQGNQLARRW